jgi:formylglycine-generating enzyme required for sulfatase activity
LCVPPGSEPPDAPGRRALACISGMTFIFLLLLGLPAWAAVDVTALEPAVVWIKADANSKPGAGCVIKVEAGRAYVLTAYHVIRSAHEAGRYEVDVRFHGQAGAPARGKIRQEWLLPQDDLAVLEVDRPPVTQRIALGSAAQLHKLDDVFAIGHPSGSNWAVTPGSVSNFEGKNILFSGDAVDPGNSGGPLVDAQGQMVGLILGERGEERGGLGMAMKADFVKLFVGPWIGELPSSPVATAKPTPPVPQPPAPAPRTPATAPKPATPSQVIRGKDGKEMVLVPAGNFAMGSGARDIEAAFQAVKRIDPTAERYWFSDETPAHLVTLDAFFIDRYEVTVGEYRSFIRATGHRALPDWIKTVAPEDRHPVVQVSWEDAVAYCQWAGKRLPTEAEWEKAARGTDGRQYPWGNEPPDGRRANFCDRRCDRGWKDATEDDAYQYTSPVGSYPAGVSPYGVHDMGGNVWEWTSSLLFPYPYKADDGREDPKPSVLRVLRGGAWNSTAAYLRASYRSGVLPISMTPEFGFRCARTPDLRTPIRNIR